jgi:hypothetical protein
MQCEKRKSARGVHDDREHFKRVFDRIKYGCVALAIVLGP